MQWETGKATVSHQESTFCNFDQTDCYAAKSIPVIFGVTDHTGYKTGGQNITVTGYGFDSGEIDAKVDGQTCKVTAFTRHEFSCTVQPSPAASDLSKKYVGQHGVSRKSIKQSSFPNYKNLENIAGTMKLNLNMEAERNQGDRLASLYKGWFIPPVDGRYRFYMTCDDKCLLQYASCPDTTTPLVNLLDHGSHSSYRDYFAASNFNGGRASWSEWVEMKKGMNYFV